MEKKTIYFESNGESGNIFAILGQVKEIITKEQFEECFQAVKSCNSYYEALDVIEEYVHLEDLSKWKKIKIYVDFEISK